MKKDFQIGLILSATDKMTSVINKAFGNANKNIVGLQKTAGKISNVAGRVALGAGAASAAILGPLSAIVDKAIQFEDKMADVAKVLNLKNGSKELDAVGKSVRDTSVYLAKMPQDVADMYAQLAQGGVPQSQLAKIAKLAGEVAVAFDIDAGLAGDRYVKITNALGITLDETKSVFDAINSISDKSAAKATQITDYLAAGGAGVARTLNITGQESAALGSVFISMGKSGEEAATIFERMTKGMMNMDRATGKIYAKAGGGIAGLMAVIEKGKTLKGAERFAFFKNFGEYGNDVAQLANNTELLQKHLGFVGDATQYAGSANKEFQNRMSTTGTKLRQAKAQLEGLAIEAAAGLLPAIKEILTAVTPLLQSMSKWIAQNPKLTAGIAKAAAVVGILAGAVAVVSGVVSAVAAVFAAVSAPVLAVVAAIAGAAFLLIKYWTPIKDFFSNLWAGVKAKFMGIVDAVWNLGHEIYEAGKNIFKELARGLIATAMLPLKPIIWAVETIRGLFPSSPAKWGPLVDLHKVDIMGQVARGVKPDPLKNALSGGLNVAMQPVSSPQPVSNYGGNNSTSVNFSPVINLNSGNGGTKADIIAALKQYEPEFMRFFENAQRKQSRAAF